MKKEYDLKQLKVKRRGILPALKAEASLRHKLRITISLDQDIVDFFKRQAKKPGELPYQTKINQVLRSIIEEKHIASSDNFENIKKGLLHDSTFINSVAKKVASKQSKK